MKDRSKIFLTKRIPLFVLVFYFAFCLLPSAYSQNDTTITYGSLEQALLDPDNVYHLDLSKQKLAAFPMDILKLKNLRTLKLAKNKIDSIPGEIKQLQNLRELDVSKNKLKEFSKGICELVNLERLILNQNSIESIPAEIKNLKKLVYLDMWDNDLWFFPDELAELKDTLKEFDLQNIQFNYEEQAHVRALLPNTKISWPPACNCKD